MLKKLWLLCIFTGLVGCSTLKNFTGETPAIHYSTPTHIALLLPLEGSFSKQGNAVRDGFLEAYYASPIKPTLSFYDTSQTSNINALYQKAISSGADFVAGPLTKQNVDKLSHEDHFPVPTLALNYTPIWFGSLPANFYQFGLSPIDEAEQIAKKAREDGHLHALVIAVKNDWGKKVANALISQFKKEGGDIQETFYFNPNSIGVPQRKKDFDVIFLISYPDSARQLVPLIKYNFLGNIPIYATSSIYSGTPSPVKDMDLNDVKFIDMPGVLLKDHHATDNRLYAVGMDTFLISQKLPELARGSISGETGQLTLNAKHQIERRLQWTTMHDGHP